tara:strand:- start:566 stop:763 length:198 start_codon:yes stop_codon:yes gene_type:complete
MTHLELLQERQDEREQYLKLTDKMRELWDKPSKDYEAIARLQKQIKELHNKLYSYTYMKKPETEA